MKLSIKKLGNQYWIVGIRPSHGPYDTLAEAESDMRGLRRWIRYGSEPGFATSELSQEEK